LGIWTIGQLAEMPAQILIDNIGDAGRHFWQLAHGVDDRPVVADAEAKSISAETTFARDIGDRDVLRSWLLELADQVSRRLRQLSIRARTIEIKLRSSDFTTHTRSVTLREPTDSTDSVWRAAAGLFDRRIADGNLPARLLGVGVVGLERDPAIQRHLFDEVVCVKQHALDDASDLIRQRFGDEAIRRAGVLSRPADSHE
jgi:DNA polymerase-4